MGLLDSGATNTFIPRQMAEIIGLDLGKTETIKVTTVGSEVSGIETTMRIIVEGERNRHEAVIPVTVLNDEDLEEVIIGRIGLFNMFKVTFHENEKFVVLKPYPESKIPKFLKKG